MKRERERGRERERVRENEGNKLREQCSVLVMRSE